MEKGGGSSKRYKRTVPHIEYTNPGSKKSIPLFDECDLISFNTILVKPTKVVQTLKRNDVLDIHLEGKTLNAYTNDGQKCGSIVPTGNEKLIVCITNGKSYDAVVTFVKDLTCKVLVKIASV